MNLGIALEHSNFEFRISFGLRISVFGLFFSPKHAPRNTLAILDTPKFADMLPRSDFWVFPELVVAQMIALERLKILKTL
jgi:hypothetical protein